MAAILWPFIDFALNRMTYHGVVWHSGRVIKGYGVASGQAVDCPYPGGSIRLQKPCFHEAGLDLSECYNGTLNLSISPRSFKLTSPEFTFSELLWPGGCETFSFSRCYLNYGEITVAGWVYYPHSETKPGHLHPDHVMEILAPRLQGISYGCLLAVGIKADEVLIR